MFREPGFSKGIKIFAVTAIAALGLAACSAAAPIPTSVPAEPPASAPVVPSGESMAGESMAGESMAGESMAGESMAGESMAGESMAGESMAGESMAGESMAGESMAGESMAGESMAGESMAGESMAGESMAGESMAGESMAGESMAGESSTLVLDFTGLQPLANGYHFEGWAIIDGSPVSTGKFNANTSGDLIDLSGKVISNGEFDVGRDLNDAVAIALTIEPPGDVDSMPSGVKYLVGDVSRSSAASANLSASHGGALGNDFSGATGKYLLATPTDGADTNETSGLWFIDLSSGGPAPGLQLPVLPSSFVYEGWVVIDGIPVSTGTFSDVAAADSGNPFSGPEAGKPFPGEDFLQNAPAGLTFPVDLRGLTAVISIEPVPDDSPAPFALKPLVGGIPADAEPFTNYQVDNQAGGFPTGTATIR